MAVNLRSDEQIVRGHVYNKTTGRWLGRADVFLAAREAATKVVAPEPEAAPLPVGETLTKAQLMSLAKESGVAGYSVMSKPQLVEDLAARGLVTRGLSESVLGGYEEDAGAETEVEG